MRLLLTLALQFLLCSLITGQLMQPCESPPYLMGKLLVSLEGEIKLWTYEYNTALQRMRVLDNENLTNQSITWDYLLHFGEGVMYEMDGLTSTCSKRPLRTDYQPIGIPDDATFIMPSVIGILSVPGAGVQLNSWEGHTLRGEQYSKFVTEVECVPHHTVFYTEKHEEVVMVFLNSTMHRTAPDDLSPPQFCPDEDAHPTGRPVDLIELVTESKARDLRRALFKLINIFKNNFSSL